MKKSKVLIIILLMITVTGCKKGSETICSNLLKQGTASVSELNGEWAFEHFAYTRNGKKIKNKDAISKGYINITDTLIYFYHTNTIYYIYTFSGSNSLAISQKGSTYINPPEEEVVVSSAFNNTKCYVISDNKLFLHYTEKDKKNILVLSKK